MITALVLAEDSPEALAVTLSALVPAVVDGLVGDAVVVVRKPDAAIARIADTVGANLLVVPEHADPWTAAAAVGRREWVLCLAAGDVPGEGWTHAIERFLMVAAGRDLAWGRVPRRAGGLGQRVVKLVSGMAPRRVRAGDLVRRSVLAGSARAGRPVRIRTLIEREPALG